jgi:two-component system, LuxR family, sensor kinase FixL
MMNEKPLTVLVIEDDADTRANLSDILELDQHQVESAATIADARARSDWADIAIILLDRKLPDGNAEDFLPELRKLAPAAEVVIVTGYRDLEGALACLHQGAADYILKPINPDALRANLRRVANAREVAQQLRLLATAIRDVKEGILITDGDLEPPGPRILFVNEALTQITGYSRDELIGKTPRIFQCPRTDRRLLDQVKDQLLQGNSFTVEIVNRRKDGRDYFTELHVSPVFDPAGRVTNYVATQRDVTERKMGEERVLQAQRLAAIGEMVTGLAHESRNALQRSMACLETLATEVEDRPETLELVKRVQKAQSHLHHLYEEVRSYAAPLNLRRAITDIAEVWREAWSQVDVLRTHRDVILREEVVGTDLQVEIDAFAIGQVFRNIFENAIVACSDPCEVVISSMPVRLDNQAAIQISILDNGPGLSPEQAQRIFDPFYTTKTKGTGLGMAITKRIVEAHGGQIAVGAKAKQGAEILVILPRRTG